MFDWAVQRSQPKINGFNSEIIAKRLCLPVSYCSLFSSGAKTDARDNQGKTALDYAVLNEKQDCVTLLKQV